MTTSPSGPTSAPTPTPITVAVLGATGRTGRPLVDELLARGHRVRALVRDPSRLGSLAERVDVVTGSSEDPAALTAALTGADAVVSALGPVKRDATLHQRTARALLPIMEDTGPRRFIGVSGAGIDVPGDAKALPDRVISMLMQRFGGAVVQDKVTEYRIWADSDLDWTLVRAPRLTDGPPTGRIEHDAHRSTRSSSLRRADLARFLADALEQGLHIGYAPFAATAKGRWREPPRVAR